MPKKVSFQIVSSSSADEQHPASELNHHGPLVTGWQSSRFCSFPQELILQFENYARVKRIQLLSHQYLIGKITTIYRCWIIFSFELFFFSIKNRIFHGRLYFR